MKIQTRRLGLYVFALALTVFATTTGGSFATDLASYEVTKSLVERGSMAMSYNVLATDAERGVDGQYYAPVGIAHPVFGIPFYVAARFIQSSSGIRLGKPDSLTKAAVVAGSALAAALCVLIAFYFAVALGGTPQGGVFVAIALAFGTPLWVYSKFGFNAPLAAALLLGGAYGAWLGIRRQRPLALMMGGISLGCAVLTRHEMSVGMLPVVLWLWLEARGNRRAFVRYVVRFAWPVAIALGLWMLYNYARFGNPLDTGLLRDPNVRFDTPLAVGLHGLLASPGRSLFLYAPLTVAGVLALVSMSRRDPHSSAFLAAFPMVFLLVYAKMHHWDGGESYGPRYLIPAVSFLILPLAPWSTELRGIGRAVLMGVFAASVAVQLPGVLMDFSKTQQAYAGSKPGYSIAMTRYTWEAAPLVLNARAAATALPRNLSYLTGSSTPPKSDTTATEDARGFSQQFSFSLDFWWMYLFYLGAVSAPAAIALGVAPLVLAAFLGIRLRRLTERGAIGATLRQKPPPPRDT